MLQPEYNGDLPKVRDEYGSAIVSDIVLIYIILIQVRQMTKHQKFTCGCEICISTKKLHASLLLCREMMNKSKTKMELSSNRRSSNLSHNYYITYT